LDTYILLERAVFVFVGKRKISGLQKAKPMIRLLDRIDGVAKYKNNWSKTLDKFYCLAPGATTEKLVKPHDKMGKVGSLAISSKMVITFSLSMQIQGSNSKSCYLASVCSLRMGHLELF